MLRAKGKKLAESDLMELETSARLLLSCHFHPPLRLAPPSLLLDTGCRDDLKSSFVESQALHSTGSLAPSSLNASLPSLAAE